MFIQFHRHRIVPGHNGGTYEPRNVIRVNISMHAFLHEQLWITHGCIEDKLASDGLRGLVGQDAIVAELHRLTGKKISASMKGRAVSAEHRKKISDALAGKPLSKEHRANVAKALIGRPCTKETRKRLSEAHIGRPGRAPWNKGKSGYRVTRINGTGWHHSEAWEKALSTRMLGNKHALGHRQTDERRANASVRITGQI